MSSNFKKAEVVRHSTLQNTCRNTVGLQIGQHFLLIRDAAVARRAAIGLLA